MGHLSDLAERARNRLVELPGHFPAPVRIEAVEAISDEMLLVRVRNDAGLPDETVLAVAELEKALAEARPEAKQADPADLFRWVESHRIRLAFAHDPYFAVSMSGVRGLPHQLEAVYRHMLPQPRLRFVLADDPGAGKTIMAGLLFKELKLRGVVDRILVVAPAPLTIQWQDELWDKFDERFEIVSGAQVHHQLGGNPWQQYNQVLTSVDFAKREEVRLDLFRADWDLVIIDEAHKCSAATYGDEVKKTQRYVLGEELARRSERLLLLTATPHSGDQDRFTHFLALLDPDQFASPDLVRRQIGLEDNPYFLRRQKEDLVDERGQILFVDRKVVTQPFELSPEELKLYEEVTRYIGEYLGQAGGARANAVALARTVLQRRLASSLGAIRSSLQKRGDRLTDLADELERLRPAERARRLAELKLIEVDDEMGTEDADEEAQDLAATEAVAAEHVETLRDEVQELRRLVRRADETIASGEERKLGALRKCLERAEFREVADGRAKLLIFTEHRDTLEYLADHLREWGYSVCTIHGGVPPAARKQIQHEFRTQYQICVATEAAGEGINLQFCHLMINYDLPWNPVRLEQRMGRIHRIGQQSEVFVVNFCATNTVEGKLLHRLHEKLEEMRADLQGRVYDVIGDLLAHSEVDFERLVKDTLLNPRRLDSSLNQISRISPEKLKEYEQQIGVAQATRNVDVSWVRQRDWESEERRLMPEYVEAFFLDAAGQVRTRVSQRADGLYRIEHVPVALRSDDLEAVRRLGRPESEYRKLTFHKEDRERAEHEDAVLLSPGHPLFASVTDALERRLREQGVPQAVGSFVDPAAGSPYWIHVLTYEVIGEGTGGSPETAYAELVAVIEEEDGSLELAAPDALHDLTPSPGGNIESPPAESVRRITHWTRASVQVEATDRERERRTRQAELRSDYLKEAIAAQRLRLEKRWTEYDEKVHAGEDRYRLLRDDMVRRIEELDRRREAKLAAFARLGVVRPGPVTYLGTAWVSPPSRPEDPDVGPLRPDPAVEKAAMDHVMAYERAQGREPTDVSHRRDGSGFDIRSIYVDPETGDIDLRRIEVKGRSASSGDVGLYRTEWYAAQRFRDGFWLYVVYGAGTGEERLVTIQDPWARLRNVEEISQVTGYRVPAASIEEVST